MDALKTMLCLSKVQIAADGGECSTSPTVIPPILRSFTATLAIDSEGR